MLLLYAATLLLSAALLFLVQPLWARLVLPLFGGAPAVWTTAMLFFQAALLLGYAYSHFAARLAPPLRALLHGLVLALPLLALPLGLPADWQPPADLAPPLALLWAMALFVGPSFVAISTQAPTLQRWFAHTGHPAAADPYFLYAASNLGSLLGLLAYPFALEPALELADQVTLWRAGHLAVVLLTLACALPFVARRGPAPVTDPETAAPPPPLPPWRLLRWVALAALPSSLMLGVTTYLSSAVAAVPLLWVLPLALYLLSFVLVFARRPLPPALAGRAVAVLLPPLVLVLGLAANHPIAVLIPLHLAAFLALAVACHGRLARDRPPPAQLTAYYLAMSVGGVLGGLANAVVAPEVFTDVVEYPLALAVATALGLGRLDGLLPGRRWHTLGPAVALGVGTALGLLLARELGVPPLATLVLALAALGCYLASRNGIRLGLALGLVLLAATLRHDPEQGRTERAERGFFGVHRVTVDERTGFRQLFHGVTVHGRQRLAPGDTCEPLLYYHPTGPIGDVFAVLRATPVQPVGVVGLGTGALACYGKPRQPFDFYEIDPLVAELARTGGFSFLQASPAQVGILLGDARLSLRSAPAGHYGLLVLDAYSSDSIPLHLLTREALALYLDKLRPDGLLACHISNRYFDLAPVLAQLAGQAGLQALVRDDGWLSPQQRAAGKSESRWLVLAREPAHLRGLDGMPGWQRPEARSGRPAWTDGRASALEAFVW